MWWSKNNGACFASRGAWLQQIANSFEYRYSRIGLNRYGRIASRLRLNWDGDNKQRKGIMKKSIITLACAMIAAIAFAQTSTTTETTKTNPVTGTTTTETTTTYSAGTVTTYEPGKTIVVKSETGPVSFALGTTARIIDGAGRIVTA